MPSSSLPAPRGAPTVPASGFGVPCRDAQSDGLPCLQLRADCSDCPKAQAPGDPPQHDYTDLIYV